LHLLIFFLFSTNFFEKISYVPPSKKEKKISLNLQQITTPKPKPVVPKPKPKPIVKKPPPPQLPVKKEEEVKKPIPKPETIKKKNLDESKKTFAVKSIEDNNITKVEPKPQKKKVVKKEVQKQPKKKMEKPKKKVVKKAKPKRSKDALANALMGSGTSLYPQRLTPSRNVNDAYAQKIIQQYYGSEFETYTASQKKFIKNNLTTIHRITQRTLTINGYPEIAGRTGQQGMNVVSFNLHPNGDISDLRLKKQIGYEALDSNTLEVIRIAYKDYPLPNKKTKIIFHVMYSLY